jgi:hypothetical protein
MIKLHKKALHNKEAERVARAYFENWFTQMEVKNS